jgi:hypothetical protein
MQAVSLPAKVPEEQASEEQAPEEQAPEEQASEEQAPEEQASEEQAPEERQAASVGFLDRTRATSRPHPGRRATARLPRTRQPSNKSSWFGGTRPREAL